MRKVREIHLVRVIRATALDALQVGTEFEADPPERGRYQFTPSISVAVSDVKVIAVKRKEVA